MLKPVYTKSIKKDIKKLKKSGKNFDSFKEIVIKLIKQEVLEPKYKDHILFGNYKGRRECHIKPDWLLIYKIRDDKIIFERTGSHSELFK